MDIEVDTMNDVSTILIMGALYYNFTRTVLNVANKIYKKRRLATARRFWVNPLNTVKKRLEQGDHHNLIREMRLFDQSRFIRHLRMTPRVYDKLLKLVSPRIVKKAGVREAIDPGTRLEITLRYLASGESCISLANQFRVGRSTVPKIIDETLTAIYDVLKNRVLREPTRENYLNTAEGFWKRWNFPHCVGAIDGKHIAMILRGGEDAFSKNVRKFGFNKKVLGKVLPRGKAT